jgi:acetyl-CoA acetyltransferase
VTRIEAGESDRTICAAWARASEHDVEAVSRVLFDPIFTAPLGLQELHVSGMRAQSWMQAGGDCAGREKAAGRRAAAVKANPRALKTGGWRSQPSYPLVEHDMPVWADVVAAVIISSKPSAVRLTGLGQSSEPFWIGNRQLKEMPSLNQAASKALQEAGLKPSQLDLIELDGLSLFDEAIGLEAIGLAARGAGMTQLASDPRCNPSGGGAAGYCAPAMGLVRIVEAALQLRGTAGAIQIAGARKALATGCSIVAAQTHTAVVLEAA